MEFNTITFNGNDIIYWDEVTLFRKNKKIHRSEILIDYVL